MTLSDLSIKRPVFAWMLMFGMIVFGAISLGRLGVSDKPDIDFPVLRIRAEWEGAAPEVMEAEIVDKIEEAVVSVEALVEVRSTIRQGFAEITLEFDINRDVDAALQEVQSAISRIRMPKDVDPPTIAKTNPDDQSILWLGITSTERSLHELMVYVDLHLKDQFQILPGVGEIMLGGIVDRNLRVWVDNEKLKQYDLTILDIQNAIEKEHLEFAAGTMENTNQESNVRMMGEGTSPAEVEHILLTQRGGKPIYHSTIRVGDVAKVEDGRAEIRRKARVNSIPGVGMGIKKQRGTNAVAVADAVKKKMEQLNRTLPKDIKIVVNFDTTVFIRDSVNETKFTLLLSGICTAVVCWLFLANWSATFNVLLSIPTSIIGSFMIIYFMGFTLNFFTLLGLALAVGIVVDDAIMVLENIVRHAELGKDRVSAAADGAREITFAAVAASVAVAAIFLPVAFMKGIIGKFFYQFGVTITGAVLLSLLEAITLTPMRCSQFLTTSTNEGRFGRWVDRQFEQLARFYKRCLETCLSHRLTVVAGAIAIFAASLGLGLLLRSELLPAQDQSIFVLRFETPVGSSIDFTCRKQAEVENYLKSRPEVLRFFGSTGGMSGDVNTGFLFVTLHPPGKRKMRQEKFMQVCVKDLSKIKDLKVIPQDLSKQGLTPKRGYPVEFGICGSDWKVLQEKTNEIMDKLNASGLVKDLNTDYRQNMPEVQIRPDRERAAMSGVTVESISQTINAAVGGVKVGKYTQDGRRYDTRIRLIPSQREQPDTIRELDVRTMYGEVVPLKDVSRLETVKTVQTLSRRNRERAITVTANMAPGKSETDAIRLVEELGRKLPPGYRLVLGGSAQALKEAIGSFWLALALGIIIAYMILASQFNSFIHPFTVLLALPFSVTGALLALLISNQSLNLYSGIGIILLMGIVKKNSILLVEFTNKKRHDEGLPLREALLTACPIRLRPILMTSVATTAAAIPPALAIGPGAESRIPMAITVIGGVLVSTLLTLFVIPCFYSLAARFEHGKNIH
ncbi:MAG: efflux RND transporter permease subunit [Verrucomicrobiae bacterium]|nr:efflux RND transporter permease subunit [Verrucomicrobiae bacterium]